MIKHFLRRLRLSSAVSLWFARNEANRVWRKYVWNKPSTSKVIATVMKTFKEETK